MKKLMEKLSSDAKDSVSRLIEKHSQEMLVMIATRLTEAETQRLSELETQRLAELEAQNIQVRRYLTQIG